MKPVLFLFSRLVPITQVSDYPGLLFDCHTLVGRMFVFALSGSDDWSMLCKFSLEAAG